MGRKGLKPFSGGQLQSGGPLAKVPEAKRRGGLPVPPQPVAPLKKKRRPKSDAIGTKNPVNYY